MTANITQAALRDWTLPFLTHLEIGLPLYNELNVTK